MAWSLDKTLAVDFDNRRYFDTSNDGKYISFLNTSNTFKVYNTATGEDMGWDIPNCYFIRFKIINSPNSLGGTFLVAIKVGHRETAHTEGGLQTISQENDKIILYKLESDVWAQIGQDIDGEAIGDKSGESVSINSAGNIVAIGAPYASGSGHVRVYENKGGTWTKIGQDIDGEAESDRSGWSVSLNSSGNIVAIGAPGNDDNGDWAGHVRVYQYQSALDTWTKIGQDIDGKAEGDFSGQSVSLNSDGNILAIGSPYTKETVLGDVGYDIGHVRIFEYQSSSNAWTQIGQDIDGETSNEISGISVSLNSNGNIIAIGASKNSDNGTVRGKVRVYENDGGTWTQIGQDIEGEARGDYSGRSVSLNSDGNIVAIGAPGNEGNAEQSGHVRVYENKGGTWTKIGQDIDGEASNDVSGQSVSLNSDGTIVAIGAHLNDINGDASGHVRVYQYQSASDTWTQIGADINGKAERDFSGWSVSLNSDGTIVAIGANGNDGSNGQDSGHVRVLNKLESGAWVEKGSYQQALGSPPRPERFDFDMIHTREDETILAGSRAWDLVFREWPIRHPTHIFEGDNKHIFAIVSSSGNIHPTKSGWYNRSQLFTINTADGTINKKALLPNPILRFGNPVYGVSSIPNNEIFVGNGIGGIDILDLNKAIDMDWEDHEVTGTNAKNSIMYLKTANINTTEFPTLDMSWFIDSRVYKTPEGSYKILALYIMPKDALFEECGLYSFDYDPVQKTFTANGHMVLGDQQITSAKQRLLFISETSSLTQISIGPQFNQCSAPDRWTTDLCSELEIDSDIIFLDSDHLNKTIHITDEGELEEVPELQKAYPSILFPELVREWTQIGQDIDGEAIGDNSGESVSINSAGNIVAIGAEYNDGNGQMSGHVRVYENKGGNWTKIGQDIDGEAIGDLSGRSVSLNSDGTIVAIGAPRNGYQSGHVRVYQYQSISDTWTKIGQDIDGEAKDDQSGYSVSINSAGDIVAIGAVGNNENGDASGHVRVYENKGGTWTKIGQDIDGKAERDFSGFSVSLNSNGNIVAIGSPNAENANGYVRVYQYQSALDTWAQIGQDIVSESIQGWTGTSVSLNSDGTILATGTPYTNSFTGHVSIFEYQSSSETWTQIGQNIEGEASSDMSGESVSINSAGDIVAIGVRENDGTAEQSGHVRVYQNISGTWTQIGQDIDGKTSFEWSGYSTSLNSDGTVVAFGAPGTNIGRARVYQLT